MRWWERVGFIVGGLLLIDPGTWTDIIGLGMLAIGICTSGARVHRSRLQKERSESN